MSNDDNGKVVKLRQPQVNKPVAGVGVGASSSGASVDEAINPKSFMNMSDLEQDMFLQQLRERRMRVVEVLKAAKAAKFRETMALKKHMRTVQPTQPIGPAHQPILSERYLALACLKMILEMQ